MKLSQLKMKKRIVRIGLLILFVLILTLCVGCWDRRELNELAIVGAIGIDKKEDHYELSLQIVNPGEVSYQKSGYDTPVTLYSEEGSTLLEAARKLTKSLPRQAYISHLRLIVIGEGLAKEGFAPVFDVLTRDHEMRPDSYVVITKEKRAKEVLEVLTSLETVPANKLFHSLEISSKAWGATVLVNANNLIATLVSESRQLVLTGVEVIGPVEVGDYIENVKMTEEPATLKYTGLAVFDKDHLIGWLTDEESMSYNYVMNNIKSTVIDIPCKDGHLGIEVLRTNGKIKAITKEKKPEINVKVTVEGNIADVECKVNLSNLDAYKKIEETANKVVKNQIEDVIKKAQTELKTDIFGFGDAIHRSAPKMWKGMKEHWQQEFSELKVKVEVDVHIKHQSSVKRLFINDMEEKG